MESYLACDIKCISYLTFLNIDEAGIWEGAIFVVALAGFGILERMSDVLVGRKPPVILGIADETDSLSKDDKILDDEGFANSLEFRFANLNPVTLELTPEFAIEIGICDAVTLAVIAGKES